MPLLNLTFKLCERWLGSNAVLDPLLIASDNSSKNIVSDHVVLSCIQLGCFATSRKSNFDKKKAIFAAMTYLEPFTKKVVKIRKTINDFNRARSGHEFRVY